MSKITLIAVVAGVAALIIGGVLEVKVHPDKLAQTPAAVKKYLTDRGTLALVGVQATRVKRKVEGYIMSDPDQKFSVAVKYVQSDTAKMVDQMESGDEPRAILLQAQLVRDSLKTMSDQLNEAAEENREQWEVEATDSITQAKYALGELQKLQEKYESYNESLATVSGDLDGILSGLDTGGTGEPDVAGATDEEQPLPQNSGGSAESPIPLRF